MSSQEENDEIDAPVSPLQDMMNDSASSLSIPLEIPTQRELLKPLELHTLDTVWHHLIPFVYNKVLCKLICKRKKLNKTRVDKLITFIYSKCHLWILTLSTSLYISYILSGAYHYNHIVTSFVYWFFITECILLLYTANFRMFKEFMFNFTFWFKTISITIGVISRQLVFDGPDRYLASGWHMFSGISFIISYFMASQIVAGLKAYHWPIGLTVVFLLLTSFLNMVQVWQIYRSDYEYIVHFLGYTISLRNTAMSAYTNATVFYVQQLVMDVYYRNYMPQMVKLDWRIDETSHDIFYSGRYTFQKTKSESFLKRLQTEYKLNTDHF